MYMNEWMNECLVKSWLSPKLQQTVFTGGLPMEVGAQPSQILLLEKQI